tara:strand:+ start:855 stop:1334 length:480 start_codon:yes stop_codon:yes gene_type:complete
MARTGIKGSQIRDNTVTGDDIDESTLVLKYIYKAKYSYTADTQRVFIRWGANGSNVNPGVNNRFIMPATGKLKKVLIRSDGTPGSTEVGLHKSSDGTEDISTTAVETQTVNLSTANTVATATFTNSATFSANDIICISVNPTSVHQNVDMTIVLELEAF